MNELLKHCPSCNYWLPVEEFPLRHRRNRAGYPVAFRLGRCRSCDRVRHRVYERAYRARKRAERDAVRDAPREHRCTFWSWLSSRFA